MSLRPVILGPDHISGEPASQQPSRPFFGCSVSKNKLDPLGGRSEHQRGHGTSPFPVSRSELRDDQLQLLLHDSGDARRFPIAEAMYSRLGINRFCTSISVRTPRLSALSASVTGSIALSLITRVIDSATISGVLRRD
jgi:hypothetical protein